MDEKKRWSRSMAVYQIYPSSFADSDNNGRGDINGITSKLDYIKDLGVGAIWLSPIYKSPMKDLGYDISDYRDIDPIFGTIDDFKILLKEAHQRGLKVMMDFVPNHTSDQHAWFKEARSSINNPKRDWYIWANPKEDGTAPNNWLSVFGGSAWELDEATGQYYLHNFLKEQPDLNWRNPEVVQEMMDTMQFWLTMGVDGFRVDAVHWLYKDTEMRDNPVNPNYIPGRDDAYHQFNNEYNQGQDGTYAIIRQFSEMLAQQDDAFMVTEVHVDIPTMQKYFRNADHNVHSPFNLNLIGMPWSAISWREFISAFDASLEPGDWPNYVLGNHDQHRIVSRLGSEARARAAALIQMTLRGMPFIYYGDEIGMRDGVIADDELQDPFGKSTLGLGFGRDPERTPMQWADSANAGFCAAEVKPWLPVNDDYKDYNVECELKSDHSMLALYKKLIHLRSGSPTLLSGAFVCLETDASVFAYERVGAEGRMLTVVNFSDKPCTVNLPYPHASVVLNTFLDQPEGTVVDLTTLSLQGSEGYLFKIG